MTQQTDASSLVSSLRAARNNAAVEGTLKLRVQSRLSVSLLGLAPTAGAALPSTHASGIAAKSGALAAKGAVVTKGVVLAWLAPVFAVGMLTGVAVDRVHVRHIAARAVAPAPGVTQPRVSVNPEPEPTETTTISPESLKDISDKRAAASVFASADSTSSLAAERRLLDEARQALARGEPQTGLAPLDSHAKRFPRGVLTEEREALAVRLLAVLGNQQAALARAENFHRRFPNSLFTPAVDNAVASFSRRNSEGESKP